MKLMRHWEEDQLYEKCWWLVLGSSLWYIEMDAKFLACFVSSLDLQSVSLEWQVKTPSKIFMKPYHMVLLVEGKPSTA